MVNINVNFYFHPIYLFIYFNGNYVWIRKLLDVHSDSILLNEIIGFTPFLIWIIQTHCS